MARIKKNDELVDTELPEKVSFLELYSCHTVEELHILSRWEENDTEERIHDLEGGVVEITEAEQKIKKEKKLAIFLKRRLTLNG